METTTLYLVRHGEAVDHVSADPGLSELGRRQAHAAGQRLRDLGVTELLHSPKRRATETASLMATTMGVTPALSDAADDRTPIPADWAQVPQRYHDFLHAVPAAERDLGPAALPAAVRELGRTGPSERRAAIVTHNFVIGWFVRDALDAPWWRWLGLNQQNAAMTVIEYRPDAPARLIVFNDTGHLPG